MGDTNYLSRVIKHPQFVLNENFILHPISALSTSRKIIKNNLPLIDCIKKLTGDTDENIKKYAESCSEIPPQRFGILSNNHHRIIREFHNFKRYAPHKKSL